MSIYFVDNGGSDGDGSFETPWNNIAGHVGTLAPNDLLSIRGDVGSHRIYTEAPITLANNGSSGSPITIAPYLNELVRLKTTPEESNKTIDITGDWWVIGGLISRLGFDKDYVGGGSSQIQFNGSDHVVVKNCELIQNGGDGAIAWDATNGGDYITIDDCIIHDTFKANDEDAGGILISKGNYITIRNCEIYDCRGDCIIIWDGGGAIGEVLIEDNHLYTTLGKCSENAVDIKKGVVTVRRCTMHGFRYCDATCGGSGGGIGGAMLGHDDMVSMVVEDCLIYDCASGVSIWSNDAECTIRRNIIRDLVTDAAAWLNAGLYLHHNSDHNVNVYNNVFRELPQHVFYFGPEADAVLRNNICDETHTISTDVTANVDADYNGWFNAEDSIVGAHDTTGSDPLFVGGGDYHLQAGSPCRNAGVDVGDEYAESAPELGRYEFWVGGGAGGVTPAGAVGKQVEKVLGGMV